MEESGLNDGLESIYASVTVWHMLTDKEFSITLKGNDFSYVDDISINFIEPYP